MTQYDVFWNPEGPGYLLDVQSDLLDGLTTRLVVPLMPQTQAPKPAARLNPIVKIAEEPHFMVYRHYFKTRKFSWVMTRKLSETLSRNFVHSCGMVSRMNARMASANCF